MDHGDIEFRVIVYRAMDFVGVDLVARGWVVEDSGADERVWFWPPTAPARYGGLGDPRVGSLGPRDIDWGEWTTPWKSPTRLKKTGDGLLLEYGEAIAQKPDEPREYFDRDELKNDLERIESWPLSIDEMEEIRMKRIYDVTRAAAHNDHDCTPYYTEPYVSRIKELRKKDSKMLPGGEWQWRGKWSLLDAEAYASAMRNERVGG